MASTADTLARLLEEEAHERKDDFGSRVIVNHCDGLLCGFVELGPGQVDEFFRCQVNLVAPRGSRGALCRRIADQFTDALDGYVCRATIVDRVRESAYR